MKILFLESQLEEAKFSKEAQSFKELFNSAPMELRKRIIGNWKVKQRGDFHPEGNTLKHIMIVTKRAFSMYPNDVNLQLAAFFHDIGKDEVYQINPKTGNPSAFGHEDVSAQLVLKYAEWIISMGGDVEKIKDIVQNHMRMKKVSEMTPKKRKEIENNPNFSEFVKFKFIDKGGYNMIDVPNDLKKLALDFKKHGNLLYLVGGAVRDQFFGKTPKDFDVATDATPDRIISILKKEGYDKIIPKGEAHGVISVIINGEEYEIATFREDGEYTDGRRPDSVVFSNINADAKRRDLTINALYYDIINDKVIDLVGGVDDIAQKKIRTVGLPQDRFEEDRIRILRAIRFAVINGSSLNSDIDTEIKRNNSLKKVSKERIRDEFLKGIMKAKSVQHYFELLKEYDLFSEILPNLTIDFSINMEIKDPVVLIADLLKKNDYRKVAKTLNELKYTGDEVSKISSLITLQFLTPDTAVKLKRMLNRTNLNEDEIFNFLKYSLNLNGKLIKAFIRYQPSLDGNDVSTKYGIKGKELGDKIEELEKEIFLNLLR